MVGGQAGGALMDPEGLPISAKGVPSEVGRDHSFFSAPRGNWGVGVPAEGEELS